LILRYIQQQSTISTAQNHCLPSGDFTAELPSSSSSLVYSVLQDIFLLLALSECISCEDKGQLNARTVLSSLASICSLGLLPDHSARGHWLFNYEGEKIGSSCQNTQGSRVGSWRSPTEALMNRTVLKVGPWTSEHTANSPDVDTSLLQASSNPTESFVWIRTTQPLPVVQMSLHKRSRFERNLVDTFLIKQLVTWFPLRDFGHSTNMNSLL
jgi:hypothetical protein